MSQRNDRVELALAVMELIDQGHRQISRHLDLTRVQMLGAVAAHEPVRPSAVAAELGLTASATSRHLAALEQAGLVSVEPDPDDARTFLVRQTDRGRTEIATTLDAGTAVFSSVLADWPETDVANALRLITRLNQAWAQHHAAARNTARSSAGPRWRQARRPAGTADEEG